MTSERERDSSAREDIDQDEGLERVEEEDMDTTHGDKLQNAVDKVTKDSSDGEQEQRRSA